jgi:hypothetical protein
VSEVSVLYYKRATDLSSQALSLTWSKDHSILQLLFAVAATSLSQFYSILLFAEYLSPYLGVTFYYNDLVGPMSFLNQLISWLLSLVLISNNSQLLDLEGLSWEIHMT